MAQSVGFGIDFGTTNSVAASLTTSEGDAYPYLDGGFPVPSFVWYSPDGVVVGRQAKQNFNAFVDAPGHRFIRSVKRQLGSGADYDILGARVPAWRIATEIFRKLRATVTGDPALPGTIENAVVTIPIHFDGAARRELRRAAAEAGIHVTTFVHEPFAAIFGYYRGLGVDMTSLENERVLVFDWGGGTLDVTLARIGGGRIEEIATGGIGDVAGDHFDAAIRGWALSAFRDRHGLAVEEARPDQRTEDKLILESERRKIELSSQDQSVVAVPRVAHRLGQPLDLEERLSRSTFEGLIETDLQRALGEVDGVIHEAGLTSGEIDLVLLIGGSSDIPRLRGEMVRRFGARATSAQNSRTAIAEGAAAIAHHGYLPYLVKPINLLLADGAALTILDRDELLPMDRPIEQTLYCTDNRDGVARLVIAERQHDRDTRAFKHHGVLSIPVSPDLPKPYEHERVVAQFSLDEDLILRVQGFGVARQEVVQQEFHDLRFGLRVQ